MAFPPTRIEHDLLGDRTVPGDAYYGVHTLRALENFEITGTPISIYPDLVVALACIKQAAALTNNELQLLDDEKTNAIVEACEEIREGRLLDEFVVDVIQGGAGTSTNMNANEVVANRALELLGHHKGEYKYLHPLDHVNMSQSTNDVYPTAVKLALHFSIERLVAAMAELRAAFEMKARIRAGAQNRPHAAAGRGADDSWPGILHLRGDARRGRAAPARSVPADPRNQSRRDRDRHGHHRASPLRAHRVRQIVGHHRHRVGDRGPISSKRPRIAARSCRCPAC